jgi:hypothetical protein
MYFFRLFSMTLQYATLIFGYVNGLLSLLCLAQKPTVVSKVGEITTSKR